MAGLVASTPSIHHRILRTEFATPQDRENFHKVPRWLSHTTRVTRKPRSEKSRTPLHLPWEFSVRRIIPTYKMAKKSTVKKEGPTTTGFFKQDMTQQPFEVLPFHLCKQAQPRSRQNKFGREIQATQQPTDFVAFTG